jgi:lipoic acid synthetase
MNPKIPTKTGVMVGLGETTDELLAVFSNLAARSVDILTIGQYLRPSKDHLPVSRFYPPDEFRVLKEEALKMGFKHVESGPLVRSSYHAHEQADARASTADRIDTSHERRNSFILLTTDTGACTSNST